MALGTWGWQLDKESGPSAPLKSHLGHLQSVRTSVAQSWAQGVAGEASVLWADTGLMAARPLLVCLQDSVLAFWSHGMQGRSLDSNEVNGTQEPGCPPPSYPRLSGEDLLGGLIISFLHR